MNCYSFKVLVEELLSQLSLLENNLHPFYGVQAFMDKNGYSEWLLLEKERIHSFIKSFWRSALPPLPALPLGYKEKHKEYKELMVRLIRCFEYALGVCCCFAQIRDNREMFSSRSGKVDVGHGNWIEVRQI